MIKVHDVIKRVLQLLQLFSPQIGEGAHQRWIILEAFCLASLNH